LNAAKGFAEFMGRESEKDFSGVERKSIAEGDWQKMEGRFTLVHAGVVGGDISVKPRRKRQLQTREEMYGKKRRGSWLKGKARQNKT